MNESFVRRREARQHGDVHNIFRLTMAKKKGKRVDPEKKAALQARKAAKADKKNQKRLQKESSVEIEDVDSLLKVYRREDENGLNQKLQIIPLEGFPPARANATLTLVEGKKTTEAYLFGGEYYDGVQNIFLNQLLKVDIDKNGQCQWKQIIAAGPVPPPRCAHTCVYYNQCLYVFGGELAQQENFHHYKDIWKFNTKTNSWEEMKPPKAVGNHPSPRSGHVAQVWKHFLIFFGGFFEAGKDAPRWFNDIYVLNLQTESWMTIPHSKLTSRPEPRSACNSAVIDDRLIIHGGFSKLSKAILKLQPGEEEVSETQTHTDAWALQLKPLLSDQPPTWERIVSSTARKSSTGGLEGRAGMASAAYKSRVLAFGGVVDQEKLNHQMKSVFFNNLFSLDVERRKWFPFSVKSLDAEKMHADADKTEGEQVQGGEGWNLDKLRSNLFAFVGPDGSVMYEKFGDRKAKAKKEESKTMDDSDSSDDDEEQFTSKPISRSDAVSSSGFMTLNLDTNVPEVVPQTEPLPRINACMVVSGHTLYLYSGLVEIGDREVTLDDMWSFDLKKQGPWNCIWPGTMHKQVWRGAAHDDNDSYISSTGGAGSDIEDEKDEDDEDDEKISHLDSTKEKRKARSSAIKQEMMDLNDRHNLENDDQTPRPNEVLSDFYSRTSDHWNEVASSHRAADVATKELKREGFALAQNRFEELEPVLSRLQALQLERKSLKEKKSK